MKKLTLASLSARVLALELDAKKRGKLGRPPKSDIILELNSWLDNQPEGIAVADIVEFCAERSCSMSLLRRYKRNLSVGSYYDAESRIWVWSKKKPTWKVKRESRKEKRKFIKLIAKEIGDEAERIKESS